MPDFLSRIKALDTSLPSISHTPIESRRQRRQRVRDAAKTPRSVGAVSSVSDRTNSIK